jgi:hypothetical protein
MCAYIHRRSRSGVRSGARARVCVCGAGGGSDLRRATARLQLSAEALISWAHVERVESTCRALEATCVRISVAGKTRMGLLCVLCTHVSRNCMKL